MNNALTAKLSDHFRSRLSTPAPSVEIIRDGAATRELADWISRYARLDLRTKAAIRMVRMAATLDRTPFPGYGTVANHFRKASSGYAKLGLLQSLVRHRQPDAVLEIGTGYGIGTIALARARRKARVVTVEYSPERAARARRNLAIAGASAECIEADAGETIAALVGERRRFDLVFHDGLHLGDQYVTDFAAIRPMLTPGAVYVIDDIFDDDRPERRAASHKHSRRTCRKAWDELAGHSDVAGALVFGGTVGILVLD